MGHRHAMISIAVKGYGIVIWERDEEWRTFSTTDALSALLAARVEQALATVDAASETEDAVCAALLDIAGASLLAVDCDHGPGRPCRDDDWN